MNVLDIIADLEAFVATEHERGTPAARIAAALAAYLDGPEGMTLEEAFSLSTPIGGDSWRTLLRRRKRDEAIRRLAEHCDVGSVRQAARAVLVQASRYQSARWRIDRDRRVEHAGPKRKALADLLESTDGALPSESTVRRALELAHEGPPS